EKSGKNTAGGGCRFRPLHHRVRLFATFLALIRFPHAEWHARRYFGCHPRHHRSAENTRSLARPRAQCKFNLHHVEQRDGAVRKWCGCQTFRRGTLRDVRWYSYGAHRAAGGHYQPETPENGVLKYFLGATKFPFILKTPPAFRCNPAEAGISAAIGARNPGILPSDRH